jgi:hypothetical protein
MARHDGAEETRHTGKGGVRWSLHEFVKEWLSQQLESRSFTHCIN